MTVKGPKGELTRSFRDEIAIAVAEKDITVTIAKENKFAKALVGTYASHIKNMIEGVTNGYEKNLEVEGVGFRWEVKGSDIHMQLGFSHPVVMSIPEGVEVKTEANKMSISGIDKELVGAFAAKVRAVKKPEPYKGKGIRYQGEYIRRKQGKRAV